MTLEAGRVSSIRAGTCKSEAKHALQQAICTEQAQPLRQPTGNLRDTWPSLEGNSEEGPQKQGIPQREKVEKILSKKTRKKAHTTEEEKAYKRKEEK